MSASPGALSMRLKRAGQLDAVYIDLHGAMVCEHLDDGEGEILARIRDVVGPSVPLIASLDLHGNVTPLMVEKADCLIAYRTYPHVDMAETGRRCAAHLGMLLGGERYAKAFRQLRFLIPIAWQSTDMEPCRSLYAELAALEDEAIPTLSFLPGFPAADFPDCGPSVIAYGRSQSEADHAADRFATMVADQEMAFAGEVLSPDEGVQRAMAIAAAGAARPVIIADTQDNPGAGGNSDTTGMLRALVANGAERAAIGLIVDRDAAMAAHRAGIGAVVNLGAWRKIEHSRRYPVRRRVLCRSPLRRLPDRIRPILWRQPDQSWPLGMPSHRRRADRARLAENADGRSGNVSLCWYRAA